MCLLVQVETAAALAQLEAIAAVDGVDGVFIGPADLSASMGHLGNPGHPAVQSAIDDGLAQILAAGKAPGILAVDETLARRYIAAGARFVAVGVEATMLARAARDLAARFKSSPLPRHRAATARTDLSGRPPSENRHRHGFRRPARPHRGGILDASGRGVNSGRKRHSAT